MQYSPAILSQQFSFAYDALNRLTRKEYPDESGVDHTYNDAGRLVGLEDVTAWKSQASPNF